MRGDHERRILVVAPLGRDARLICLQLKSAGLQAVECGTIGEVAGQVPLGVGAIILTEEAVTREGVRSLVGALAGQPAWSEIPLIILAGDPVPIRRQSFEGLDAHTNVTLVDRPVRIKALVSAAQSALRARERQYQVRDLMAQLEDRLHERDKFLAILGHELRNPLSAILLAAQMTDDDGKLDNEHARMIERQSRHLTQLVNDLLDLSRVVTGKIVLKPQPVDLREIAAQSLRTFEAASRKQDVEVTLSLSSEPVRVHADPVRIDQIITNLLGNAIKYTPSGGKVHVLVEKDDASGRVLVSDDGVGIAPDRIDGIFEMFAQLDNAIGRAQGGMGIGLALVRNLVQLHGGTVTASSAGVGRGSRFTVELPLTDAQVSAAEPSDLRALSDRPVAARSIVIIEDNDDVRELLGKKLRRLGHDVVGVSDGVEGLNRLVDTRPDLALVDLGLPGLDGFEVARQAREKLGNDIVLVAVSGFGQPEDKRRALEAGFDEHLTKPADVREIESLLVRFPARNSSPAKML